MRIVRQCVLFLFIFLVLGSVSVRVQASFQPSAPYYSTFFYFWSENPNTDGRWSYWNDNGHSPPQNWFSNYLPDPLPEKFDPATELYSSRNDQIIYWQLRKLAEAKQEVAIGSWWGQNHKSDVAFRKMIKDVMNRSDNPYPNLRWSLYYEKEGFGNPPLSELISDLNYIKANYANEPGFLKIDGKPVIFVYNAAHSGFTPMEDVARWIQARTQTGFYVVMKNDPLASGASPTVVDGWHDYAPANRTGAMGTYYHFVSPGFWLDGNAVRLSRDINAFKTAVDGMVSSTAIWRLTETWNEWGEGSSVEPGEQVAQTKSGSAVKDPAGAAFGNQFIDALKAKLPPLEQGTGQGGAGGNGKVVMAAGDIVCAANSSASCRHKDTSDLIVQENPDAVFALGDLQYEAGEYQNFLNIYDPTWGRFKDKTYPSIGNHEYGTPGGSGYFDYFNGVGVQTGKAGDRAKGYYSFNIGAWHVVSLNSNCRSAGGCNKGSAQEVWLRQDLAANPGACTIALTHHARYSSGYDGNNAAITDSIVPLWEALYDHGAEIVLSGHSHHYERFAPQTPYGTAAPRGVRQFVVGTGGRNFTGFWNSQGLVNSEIKNNTSFGVLKLILNDTSYSWEFKPAAGGTFIDSGTAICHPAPTVTNACSLSVQGDGNGDGQITLADYAIWKKSFVAK